jgi:hypothetical protein
MATIYPYQWELLAAMITYKVTRGLCLDYARLNGNDYYAIHKESPTLSKDSLRKWFAIDRPPPSNALEDLINYTKEFFPYNTWGEFSHAEENSGLFSACPDWNKYDRLHKAPRGTKDFRVLQDIKTWVYGRVLSLAKKSWSSLTFRELHTQQNEVSQFAGVYKVFKPGQIPPKKYKRLYVDPLTIKEDGEVIYENAYIHKEYSGHAILKERNTLQMVIYSEKNGVKDGFEYGISIRTNNYGKTARHFAGVVLAFDGENNIYSYPVLLTSDLSLTIESRFVKQYFNYCYDQLIKTAHKGRLECLTSLNVLELEQKFLKVKK